MDSKLQKTVTRVVLAAVAIGAIGMGVRSYTSSKAAAAAATAKDAAAAANRVVPVVVVPVVQRDMPIYLDGLGNVLASATVTVHVQVDGKLERVVFKEGQDVKKGDLLAQIDARPFIAALNSAQGALARDSAQHAEAIKNLERFQELARQGLTSAQTVDDQAALVLQLKGTVAADQAAIDSARLSVEYTRITSPDGRGHRHPPGRPGQPRPPDRRRGHRGDHHARSHRGHLHAAAGHPDADRDGDGRRPRRWSRP